MFTIIFFSFLGKYFLGTQKNLLGPMFPWSDTFSTLSCRVDSIDLLQIFTDLDQIVKYLHVCFI